MIHCEKGVILIPTSCLLLLFQKMKNILSNVRYIYASSKVIIDSLKQGYDVAQLENGDLFVTKTVIKNQEYKWNKKSNKFIRNTDDSVLNANDDDRKA